MPLDRDQFGGLVSFIGSILGLITGFLYFGLGGAILGFCLGALVFLFLGNFLSDYGEDLGCLFQIVIICILIFLLWGKCAPMSLFKSDHNDEKNKINPTDQKLQNQDAKPKESVKTDTPTPDSFKESVKKLNNSLRNKDVTQIGEADNQINNNSSKSEELLDKITSKNTVDMKHGLQNDIDFSLIDYPYSFLTTSDSQFLAADGKETVIPANTRITILKRTPAGMLTLEAGGKTYLGYESRLSENIKK